ncbi:hypothetical protein BJ956_001114 [Arthrobacter psychrochitiniphilus]|nr:hypothetical protein [Arthrobacter psychrochitiniphilus]
MRSLHHIAVKSRVWFKCPVEVVAFSDGGFGKVTSPHERETVFDGSAAAVPEFYIGRFPFCGCRYGDDEDALSDLLPIIQRLIVRGVWAACGAERNSNPVSTLKHFTVRSTSRLLAVANERSLDLTLFQCISVGFLGRLS